MTAETRGLIGRLELAALPAHAIIINCARGGIVDELALADALRERRIAGAGTDVFEVEPPPTDHPFFALDSMILAPHAGANTAEALERMARATAENILAALDGSLGPETLVNPSVLASA